MSLLLETIRIENGVPDLLEYHQARMMQSTSKIFGKSIQTNLDELIRVPPRFQTGIVKCRIFYDKEIRSIEFMPYKIRVIEQLIILDGSDIHYEHKYADRTKLYQTGPQLSTYQEILFVRNELITDTRFTNVALYDGKQWFTPAKPMLAGTRRAFLIKSNIIKPADISLKDLLAVKMGNVSPYSKIRLFNAMIKWTESIEIEIKDNNILINNTGSCQN